PLARIEIVVLARGFQQQHSHRQAQIGRGLLRRRGKKAGESVEHDPLLGHRLRPCPAYFCPAYFAAMDCLMSATVRSMVRASSTLPISAVAWRGSPSTPFLPSPAASLSGRTILGSTAIISETSRTSE